MGLPLSNSSYKEFENPHSVLTTSKDKQAEKSTFLGYMQRRDKNQISMPKTETDR